MPSTQKAPGQLELVRQFVNTRDIDTGADQLSSPKALAAWLAEHGLLANAATLDEADRERALGLREALRALMLANNGAPIEKAPLATLNRALDRAPLKVRFDEDGVAQLSVGTSGLDSALAGLAAIVYEAKVEGTWPRLKACPADDCHGAFYDHSRNRSGTWCTMAVCGNRAKVRAFRERRAGNSS
jgi:predicted RNA-binding Zn ribbon-like protein